MGGSYEGEFNNFKQFIMFISRNMLDVEGFGHDSRGISIISLSLLYSYSDPPAVYKPGTWPDSTCSRT